MSATSPPSWAEKMLRLLLSPEDRDIVSGDMLELYRTRSHRSSADSRRRDLWYIGELARLLWVQNRAWIALLSLSLLARTAVDRLAPTNEFHARAIWSTLAGIGTILSAGFVAGYRTSSVTAAAICGATTAVLAAAFHTIGTAVLLAIWHGPDTWSAIEQSGGLSEAFTLPMLLFIPGISLGSVAGGVAAVLKRARRIGAGSI